MNVIFQLLFYFLQYEQGSKPQEENYTYVVLKKGQRSAEQGKPFWFLKI